MGRFTLQPFPRLWFVWKYFDFTPQMSILKNLCVQKGGFQKTACPKDRQDESWLCPCDPGSGGLVCPLKARWCICPSMLYQPDSYLQNLPVCFTDVWHCEGLSMIPLQLKNILVADFKEKEISIQF